MQKFITIIFILLFSNCSGYQPIFDSSGLTFYLKDIKIEDDTFVSRLLSKRLESLKKDTNNKPLMIKLKSFKKDNVISRDDKGDPSIFELVIEVTVELVNETQKKNFLLKEAVNYNNNQNKFELEQYKKTLINSLTNRIAEKIILNLKEIN